MLHLLMQTPNQLGEISFLNKSTPCWWARTRTKRLPTEPLPKKRQNRTLEPEALETSATRCNQSKAVVANTPLEMGMMHKWTKTIPIQERTLWNSWWQLTAQRQTTPWSSQQARPSHWGLHTRAGPRMSTHKKQMIISEFILQEL